MGGGPSRPRGRGLSSSLYFSETESDCSRSGSSLESGGEGCAPETATRAGSRTPCSQCQCSCSEAGSVRTALHGTDTRMEMLRLCLRHEIEQLNSRAAARRVGAPARTIDGSTAPARRYAVYRQQRPFRRPRGSARAEELVPFVLAYDEFLSGPLADYLREAKKLGGDAASHADQVQRAFQAQRDFIVLASKSKKPDDATTAKLLKPQADIIQEITAFREKNRRSPLYNHLSTISESIAALSWVVTAPAPAPLVKEMNDAGLFWGNRVIKENKAHQAFTRAWSAALSALQAYVKQHHTTGLSWNLRGGDAAAIAGGDAAPAARGSGPPPPPPPPPPAAAGSGSCDSTDKQRAALFSEINRGAAVTQGLRHVTKNMQTHKNADLRVSSTVPGDRAAAAAPKSGGGRGPAAPKKPVCELQGKKWVVEHQDNNLELTLDQTQMNQVVYCFNCVDSVIQVKGKVNSIILDTCKKSAVIFDSTVASVEFVNCISCQMQVNEKVPTISIDKTDGLQMYLSPQSLDVVLVTSKSSEMNVLIPKGDGDYTELAVAEQFKTTIEGKKLVTVVNEST